MEEQPKARAADKPEADEPKALVERGRLLNRYFNRLSPRGLQQTAPLIGALREIAAAHGATPAQVALSWLVHFYGATVVAIPGTTSAGRAAENAAAMGLRLADGELARLDQVSRAVAAARR